MSYTQAETARMVLPLTLQLHNKHGPIELADYTAVWLVAGRGDHTKKPRETDAREGNGTVHHQPLRQQPGQPPYWLQDCQGSLS